MSDTQTIKTAIISVYHKQGLELITEQLIQLGVTIYSTGGTAKYLKELGAEVIEIEDLTGYPSILGGRVKTLHPKVHGGILARRDIEQDVKELEEMQSPPMDLVIVDLYPFEDTVKSGASEEAIIEKIDIGGIALIRGAAKNFNFVTVISSKDQYADLANLLEAQKGEITLEQRKAFAAQAFNVSSHYDTHIFNHLAGNHESLKISHIQPTMLRYGENPHQKGYYYGDLTEQFEQLNGKALSYNNLVDIDSALQLVDEFTLPFFAVIKHTNPCGCAIGKDLYQAWDLAIAGDPVSAFGGILACNGTVDRLLAGKLHDLFFEVLIAEDFTQDALELLTTKKKRILLKRTSKTTHSRSVKSILNGFIVQEKDTLNIQSQNLEIKTTRQPSHAEVIDLLVGIRVVKHLKSNAIALVKNGQLIGSGVGQTSRIDALEQSIAKAKKFGFDPAGAVLASDAFFPFKDSVEAAHSHGIEIVIQPGGSIRDAESIEFCEANNMCMVFTGSRHFKH